MSDKMVGASIEVNGGEVYDPLGNYCHYYSDHHHYYPTIIITIVSTTS
jgi:hypothetical protein